MTRKNAAERREAVLNEWEEQHGKKQHQESEGNGPTNWAPVIVGFGFLVFVASVLFVMYQEDQRIEEVHNQQNERERQQLRDEEKEHNRRLMAVEEYIHDQLKGIAKDTRISSVFGERLHSSNDWHPMVYAANVFKVDVEYVRSSDGTRRKVMATIDYSATDGEMEIRKWNFALNGGGGSYLVDPTTGKFIKGFDRW